MTAFWSFWTGVLAGCFIGAYVAIMVWGLLSNASDGEPWDWKEGEKTL